MTTTGSSAVRKRVARGTGGRKRRTSWPGTPEAPTANSSWRPPRMPTPRGHHRRACIPCRRRWAEIRRCTDRRDRPHPYNDPKRSTPRPDSSRWTELVESVRAAGVRRSCWSRAAFVQARPILEDAIGPDVQYVIVYGHRRHAAALAAGLEAIPAVVDDAVLIDGGDLDAMTIENLGREDLTELQQAEMFAHYSEAGLGQRMIAEKLGVNQSTVSRRLSLLLLSPEILEAVECGKIKSTEAAELASKLPFGPARPWQQEVDPEQEAAHRHADQLAAYELVVAERPRSVPPSVSWPSAAHVSGRLPKVSKSLTHELSSARIFNATRSRRRPPWTAPSWRRSTHCRVGLSTIPPCRRARATQRRRSRSHRPTTCRNCGPQR